MRPTQRAPDWWESARFWAVVWLEVGSVKVALPHSAHLRVTHTVRRLSRLRVKIHNELLRFRKLMSNQPAIKLPPRPLPRGVILLTNLSGGLVLLVCIIFLFVLLLRNDSGVEARDAIFGIKFEDGHRVEDPHIIPADAKEIYVQFYLEKQGKGDVPIEVRWYAGDQLAHTSSDYYGRGYVTAYLEADLNKTGGFRAGNYHVEVWFRNTMILSKPFVVE